ncbi:LuxR C-terminal-related transcriptional regulator [Paraburkholderia sp. ZP32-5]|uniref:LuxR C-terminal-related transcriptional regulator n=1 Tax=Paraburkholderia sp. ZP32-5 TaxID=2883245 RepID=UPI001F2CA2C0|nr:response regulator transcription factor [Paraburkholderia sp. ZP32-5]
MFATLRSNQKPLPSPVLIVENELPMQNRLRAILIALGYGEKDLLVTGNIADALETHAKHPCAIALIDIRLSDGSGIDLIRTWHACDPALPILVISASNAATVIVAALQAGAVGYLLKERDDIEIALSVRSALRGGAPIDPFVARYVLETSSVIAQPVVRAIPAISSIGGSKPAPISVKLSRRETEVLTLVSKGLANREISDLLSLSKLTVESHIKNMFKKLHVRSRTEAIFEARAQGLLP